MKNILLAALLLLSAPAMAQMETATLTASGLTCSMCSRAIYKALEKVPFIDSVSANVETSEFTVHFRKGAPVVIDDVKKAVQDAGFSVASMHVTALFDNTEVYNDAHIVLGGSNFHFLNVQKQTLLGEKTFTIVDKNYLPAKAYKKYGSYTTMKCFTTGMTAACCPGEFAGTAKRIYHATL